LVWGDRRQKPSKALKIAVYERDKGFCGLCHKKVNPLDFDIGHNIAYSKGGKLNYRNAVLLHPVCNRSMGTRNIRQERKRLGLPETSEEKTRKTLKGLTTDKLKYLAKKHRIRVKGRVSEGLLIDSKLAPSKIQYINALSKVLKEGSINKELKRMPKQTKKKRRKRS
jgi:hypothetical protein